ncbi:MAG: VOC family protein [Chitinophaga sp.]|uniref:VOC family protein n=1 Tax=Chitinophaga sp. TaxID=1869181 RepID=UPI001B2526EF|nr:VOC family protein [Chitinophaga sp.]MBO9729539.1 VOC family protein [Chitinophaga sp.]
MFKNTKAYSGFSVNDLQAAKDFYSKKLGVDIESKGEYMFTLKIADGHPIIVYLKPDHTPATFTILNFPVSNVEDTVDQLTAIGVEFLQYGGAIKTNEKGIHRGPEGPTVAWFTDPAGNILSVVSE